MICCGSHNFINVWKKEQNMKPWINTLFSWCTLFVYDGQRHGKKFLQHAPSFVAIIFFCGENMLKQKVWVLYHLFNFRFWFWILFFCFFFVKLAKISSMTQGKFLMSVDRWAFLSALGFSRRFTNFQVRTTFEKGNLQTEPVYFNFPFALNFLPNTSRNLRCDNSMKTICNLDFSYLDYLLYLRKRGELLFFFLAISVKYLKFVYQFIVVVTMRILSRTRGIHFHRNI